MVPGRRGTRIDPRDAAIRIIGRLDRGGCTAFAGRDIYLAGSADLRRVKGVVPP